MLNSILLKNKFDNRRSIIEFCFLFVVLIIVTYVNRNRILILESSILDAETYQTFYTQFESSRLAAYLSSVGFLIIRCFLGAACLFLGGLMDNNYSKLSYKVSVSSLVKVQWFLVLLVVISNVYFWITGSIFQLQAKLSLSAIPFISSLVEVSSTAFLPAVIILQSFNVFQVVYLAILAMSISRETNNKYFKSLWFVLKTYGLGYLLFHISVAFAIYTILS